MFGRDIDESLKADICKLLDAARVTLVEHAMMEAQLLYGIDRNVAVDAINNQIKLCLDSRDQNGDTAIKPATMLHPAIWRHCQRAIAGKSLD